jgi:hypothetical protein
MDGTEPRVYTTGEIQIYSWSPDGESLIFSDKETLFLGRLGQPPHEIRDPLGSMPGKRIEEIHWIDNTSFLGLVSDDRVQQLWVGNLAGDFLIIKETMKIFDENLEDFSFSNPK